MDSREEWIGRLVEARGLVEQRLRESRSDHDKRLIGILDEVIGDIENQLYEEWNSEIRLAEEKEWTPPF